MAHHSLRVTSRSIVVLVAAAFAGPVVAGEPPTSPAAVAAQRKHDDAVAQAKAAYRRAAADAAGKLITELKGAQKAAMAKQDLAEANRIADALKAAEAALEEAGGKGKTVTVDAKKDWQDAAEVRKGDKVRIRADGRWCANTATRDQFTVGPDGMPAPFGAGGQKFAYLEARIGTGEPFAVGASLDLTAAADGMLQFRIADVWRADNDGELRVQVSR